MASTERVGEMELHPLCALWPAMQASELDELAASIGAQGLLDPIMMLDGKVLDGRNRLQACYRTGTQPRFETFEGDARAAAEYVVSRNARRRHLNAKQRADIVLKVFSWKKSDGTVVVPDGNAEAPLATSVEMADVAGVSPRTIVRRRAVAEAEQSDGDAGGDDDVEPAPAPAEPKLTPKQQLEHDLAQAYDQINELQESLDTLSADFKLIKEAVDGDVEQKLKEQRAMIVALAHSRDEFQTKAADLQGQLNARTNRLKHLQQLINAQDWDALAKLSVVT